MASQERPLTEDEREYCEEIIKDNGDSVRFIGWVEKKKRDKEEQRILVIGRYRVFSIKRGWTGSKKVRRSGHLFELKEIVSEQPGQVTVTFGEFFIDAFTPRATEAIAVLRTSLQDINWGFPETFRPAMRVQQEYLVQIPAPDPGPGGGYIKTYRAMCNLDELEPSTEFIRYVELIIEKNSTVLDLSTCPGIEPKTEYTFDLRPVVEALRHNVYFKTIVLRDVPRRDAVVHFADPIKTNTTLTSITLRGLGASDGFIQLGLNLGQNKNNQITYVDLSHNNVGNRNIREGISVGLAAVQHPMTYLDFTNCGLSGGVQALMLALENNSLMSIPLVELYLSKNKLGREGSEALSKWLASLKFADNAGLRRLVLSNTQLDVGQVTNSIKTGCPRLTALDVSQNRIDRSGAQSLAIVMATTACLTNLNMAGTRVNGESVEAVFQAMLHNDNLPKATINASNNDLGSKGANNVASAVLHSRNLVGLLLRGNGFGASGVVKVVESLMLNTTLTRLSLDCNVVRANRAADATQSLAKLVTTHPCLQALSIRGKDKYYLGKHITKIFEALAANRTITAFDISGNRMGDPGASALTEVLRANRTLTALRLDNNQISLPGWLVIKSCFTENKVLCDLTYPRIDEERACAAAGGSKEGLRLREKIRSAVKDVMDAVKSNYLEMERNGRLPEKFVDDDDDDVVSEADANAPNAPTAAPPGAFDPYAGDTAQGFEDPDGYDPYRPMSIYAGDEPAPVVLDVGALDSAIEDLYGDMPTTSNYNNDPYRSSYATDPYAPPPSTNYGYSAATDPYAAPQYGTQSVYVPSAAANAPPAYDPPPPMPVVSVPPPPPAPAMNAGAPPPPPPPPPPAIRAAPTKPLPPVEPASDPVMAPPPFFPDNPNNVSNEIDYSNDAYTYQDPYEESPGQQPLDPGGMEAAMSDVYE